MSEARDFHIGDILSITTGRLVSPRHMDGIYDICNFMTGDNLFTHQLPRAMDECAPSLREQFPDLAAVEVPEYVKDEASVGQWLAHIASTCGSHRMVAPLAPEDHTHMDPFSELERIAPGKPVIAVVLPEDGTGE